MPKPKRIKPAPRISSEEYATRSLLNALLDLNGLNKFRLAACVTWMRREWKGSPDALENVDAAVAMIDALTMTEEHDAMKQSADLAVCAAVTS